MSDIQAKSCPFCGGDAETYQIGSFDRPAITGCPSCDYRLEYAAQGNYSPNWNKRAPIVITDEMVERACVAKYGDKMWKALIKSDKCFRNFRIKMHAAIAAALGEQV